ncbi:MAG: cyclic nucleotide-binding domain-containing protein [Planctomycetota bacterium]
MPMLTADFLASIPIFQGMTEAERNQLLQVMVRETFAPGEEVVQSGKIGRGLHLVVEGSAVVLLDVYGYANPLVENEVPRVVDHADVARLEIGSVFGEISFFHPTEHSATVRATSKLELLTLSAAAYDEMLCRGNSAAYKIAVNASRILARRLRGADKLIEELVLAQQDSIARTRWFESHVGVHVGTTLSPRFEVI